MHTARHHYDLQNFYKKKMHRKINCQRNKINKNAFSNQRQSGRKQYFSIPHHHHHHHRSHCVVLNLFDDKYFLNYFLLFICFYFLHVRVSTGCKYSNKKKSKMNLKEKKKKEQGKTIFIINQSTRAQNINNNIYA